MLTSTANEDIRTSFWPRVREFAVPASMIETATARRLAGDWAGACAAAGFDVDLNLRAVARDHGRELASRVRSDLRALAPDLLRWHMPRIAPDGLLRPGLTLTLARYDTPEGPVHLVGRTAPAWADAGQRISLALWSRSTANAVGHPHPRPNRRFRLDLHRHLWDAGRAGELGARSGAGEVRERDWGGELRDPDAAADVRERSRPGEARERHWGGELRDPDGAAEVRDWTGVGEGYDRTGTSQTRDRHGASDTRDPTGTAEARDQTATNQTHHQTGTAEDDDRTGTSQTRDRARTSQIPDQLPDRTEAAEGHNQTGTSQTPDQTGTDELRQGSDVGEPSMRSRPSQLACHEPELMVSPDCAVDRWAAESGILLAAEGRTGGVVLVRLGGRERLVLELGADDDVIRPVPTPSAGTVSALPVLPDAATWVLPDLQLLRAGAIEAERLHPLVAAALAPDRAATGPPRTPDRPGRPRLVECRGARHRIGLVDGVLAPLDHDPDEIRREELLVALTGTPLPCLQAIDEAHRRPHCLAGVRERLVHGDTAGALAVVEGLLGPDALLRTGPLRDELEAAALRRITYGLFRAGLTGPGPNWFRPRPSGRDSRNRRNHPRHAT
ncbi:hypothetical protein [Streptomyces sp. Root369]|uniref:hypothetical protein n=1 Tax=Streptomyces sp. Root369 TaxID=1736523 RepID=UPI00071105DB|nr:hypothetical protein [Streptomyces sp. Root369]KQW14799.1 hypothetical protein ASD08_28225 [Streptomyces sp. Root369]